MPPCEFGAMICAYEEVSASRSQSQRWVASPVGNRKRADPETTSRPQAIQTEQQTPRRPIKFNKIQENWDRVSFRCGAVGGEGGDGRVGHGEDRSAKKEGRCSQ